MNQETYTANQVFDALLRQGFSRQQAMMMAEAMGPAPRPASQIREGLKLVGAGTAKLPGEIAEKAPEKGSSLVPNLTEGLGFTAGYFGQKGREKTPDVDPKMFSKRNMKRLGMGGAGGMVGGLLGEAMSGTDFYQRASDEELMADMAGNIGGGFLGEAVGNKLEGKGVGKKIAAKTPKAVATAGAVVADNAKKVGKKAAATKAGQKIAGEASKRLVSRLVGSGVGKGMGSLMGAPMGPLGAIAGGALGGWLLPKFFDEDEDEEEKTNNSYSDPLGG